MFAILNISARIDELKALVHQANAVKASQLLIDLCDEFPMLAGILTLIRQGSLDDALTNVAMFDPALAKELRGHWTTLVTIQHELNRREPHVFVGVLYSTPSSNCGACNLPDRNPIHKS